MHSPTPLTDTEARAKGWPDADTARWSAAIHEAGHAMSFLLGGAGVDEAVMRPDGTGYVTNDPRYTERVRAQDMIAGSVAERLHGVGNRRRIPTGDINELQRWMETFHVEPDPAEVMAAAVEELSTALSVARVRALAQALLERGRLSGEECLAIARAATPSVSGETT